MNTISWETIKRALYRGLSAMVIGAAGAYVMVPVNLDEPKKYFIVLGVSMLVGALQALQKLISGYIKYDYTK